MAAAWACGMPITEFGPVITDQLIRLESTRPTREQVGSQVRIQGMVCNHDHFGNLLTNIRRADLGGDISPVGPIVELAGKRIGTISQCYADVAVGEVLVLFGSQDRLEIAVSGGSAADALPDARTVVVTYTAS
ncbi:MAG: SAM hydroxide adenosyltransferase [Chitinophagaceae bacterium]